MMGLIDIFKHRIKQNHFFLKQKNHLYYFANIVKKFICPLLYYKDFNHHRSTYLRNTISYLSILCLYFTSFQISLFPQTAGAQSREKPKRSFDGEKTKGSLSSIVTDIIPGSDK